MTQTSAGFSMATMALAAKSNFSQVFLRLMMYTPGESRQFYDLVHTIKPQSHLKMIVKLTLRISILFARMQLYRKLELFPICWVCFIAL